MAMVVFILLLYFLTVTNTLSPIFFFVYALILASLLIGIQWRRFQDLGYPGKYSIIFWLLAIFLPIVGSFVAPVLMFKQGVNGPNQYGNDPNDEVIIGKDKVEFYLFWPAFIFIALFLAYQMISPRAQMTPPFYREMNPSWKKAVMQKQIRQFPTHTVPTKLK